MNSQTPFSAESFIKAVNLLFTSKDKTVQNNANRFLVEFDQSPESWDIALQILSTETLDDTVYFNALNVLRNKIKYDFGNYIENSDIILNLLKFLIDRIVSFQNSKHYLILNFCKCFAIGMIFSIEKFNDVLKYCVSKLNTENNLKNLMSLMMIFNYFTETRNDEQIVIDETNRKIFQKNLDAIECDVLHFLNMMVLKRNQLQSGKSEHKEENENYSRIFKNDILETFTNWISFGLGEEALRKLSNDYIEIINFVFTIEEDQIQKHAECICNLLQLPLEREEMKNLTNVIMGKISGLIGVYNQKKGQLDSEEIAFFISIVNSICVNSIDKIIDEKEFYIFNLVVELTEKCPSEKIVEICDIWEIFMQIFDKREIPAEDVLKQFKPVITQSILYMINLMKYPNGIFKELNVKRRKNVQNENDYITTREFRDEIRQLFKRFAQEYSFEFMYNEVVFPQIEKTVNLIKADPNNITHWSNFEALLYAFVSFCSEAEKFENIDFLNTLFNTLFEIPNEFVQIIRTITDVFDEMNKFLNKK